MDPRKNRSGICNDSRGGISTTVIATAIIMIAAVAVIGVYTMSENDMEATIEYTVTAATSEEGELFVYIDGNEVPSDTRLRVGDTYSYTYKMSEEEETVIIEAVLVGETGEELYRTTKEVTVHADGVAEITLSFERT